jgi:hypothetical protein
MDGPLKRKFGEYDLVFRKSEHTEGRPTPHVEIWKAGRKIGNYDMASGRPLPSHKPLSKKLVEFLNEYLSDAQVRRKLGEAITSSFFDLSKPAGTYGAVPKGFKAVVTVEIPE